eukprot:TRINITY_DN302_c0_g1_i1.p2 TRINITY_DN302_c0_g1~~TRINITY_DN302_c0_g1_i1.p2  ORF type:complete len:260 (+),score=33.25 TRINITY_DN302_c0_g1_i1:56-835(+)
MEETSDTLAVGTGESTEVDRPDENPKSAFTSREIHELKLWYEDEAARQLLSERSKEKKRLILNHPDKYKYFLGRIESWGITYGAVEDTIAKKFIPGTCVVSVRKKGNLLNNVVLMALRSYNRELSGVVRFEGSPRYQLVDFRDIDAFQRELSPEEIESERELFDEFVTTRLSSGQHAGRDASSDARLAKRLQPADDSDETAALILQHESRAVALRRQVARDVEARAALDRSIRYAEKELDLEEQLAQTLKDRLRDRQVP